MANATATLILMLKDEASKGMNSLGGSFKFLKGHILAVTAAVTAVVGTLMVAFRAYGQQKEAVAKLDTALANSAGATAGASKRLQELAGSLQKTTNVSDDATITNMALLTSFGLNEGAITKLMPKIIDLASTGIDLRTATLAIGRAITMNSTGALERYGVKLDETAFKTNAVDAVTEALTTQLNGQAAAIAGEPLGRLKQLGQVWDDLMKICGEFITGPGVGIINWLISLAETLISWKDNISLVITFIGAMFSTLGDAIAGLALIYTDFFTISVEIFTSLYKVLSLLSQAIKLAVTGHFTEAKNKSVEAFNLIKNTGIESYNKLKTDIGLALTAITTSADVEEKKVLAQKKVHIAEKDKVETEGYFVSMDKFRKHNKEWDDLFGKQNTNMLNVQNDSLIKYDAKDMQQKAGFLERLKAWYTTQSSWDEKNNQDRLSGLTSTLDQIATLSTAHNKTLARVGKVAAISTATIQTYLGVARALGSAPWPFNLVLAAGALTAGLMNAAKISGVALAEGGIVMPRSGGIQATIGEGGRAEAVIPLGDSRAKEQLRETLGGGETIVNINAGVIVADDYSLRQLARMIDEKLFELQQNRQTLSV